MRDVEEIPRQPGRASWNARAVRGSGRIGLEEAWSLIGEIAATDPVLRELNLGRDLEVAICPSRQRSLAYAAAIMDGASAGTPRPTAAALKAVLTLCDPRRPGIVPDPGRYSDVYTLSLPARSPSATVRAAACASGDWRAEMDARYLAAADRLSGLGLRRAAAGMRRHAKDPGAWERRA